MSNNDVIVVLFCPGDRTVQLTHRFELSWSQGFLQLSNSLHAGVNWHRRWCHTWFTAVTRQCWSWFLVFCQWNFLTYNAAYILYQFSELSEANSALVARCFLFTKILGSTSGLIVPPLVSPSKSPVRLMRFLCNLVLVYFLAIEHLLMQVYYGFLQRSFCVTFV